MVHRSEQTSVVRKTQNKRPSNNKSNRVAKKRHHSDNPTYLSGSFQEYLIEIGPDALFYIRRYKGGRVNKKLQGRWTTHSQAEEVLINFLIETDYSNQSRYPNSPPRRPIWYTETYLNAK